MTIKIKKEHIVFWLAVFLLQVLLIAYLQGWFPNQSAAPPPHPFGLQMTQEEARLARQAIELVREDVVSGSLPTTALTVQALSSLLPTTVRDAVLNELGTPDMDFMRDALDILEGRIEGRSQ